MKIRRRLAIGATMGVVALAWAAAPAIAYYIDTPHPGRAQAQAWTVTTLTGVAPNGRGALVAP